jgi:hypothetical protein
MYKTITRNVGQNRGKPRLWIEGKALVESGLDHGNRWDLIPNYNGFTIKRNPDGKRKIAGKLGRPIIDICGASLGDTIGKATAALLDYEIGSGVIKVTPANTHNTTQGN